MASPLDLFSDVFRSDPDHARRVFGNARYRTTEEAADVDELFGLREAARRARQRAAATDDSAQWSPRQAPAKSEVTIDSDDTGGHAGGGRGTIRGALSPPRLLPTTMTTSDSATALSPSLKWATRTSPPKRPPSFPAGVKEPSSRNHSRRATTAKARSPAPAGRSQGQHQLHAAARPRRQEAATPRRITSAARPRRTMTPPAASITNGGRVAPAATSPSLALLSTVDSRHRPSSATRRSSGTARRSSTATKLAVSTTITALPDHRSAFGAPPPAPHPAVDAATEQLRSGLSAATSQLAALNRRLTALHDEQCELLRTADALRAEHRNAEAALAKARSTLEELRSRRRVQQPAVPAKAAATDRPSPTTTTTPSRWVTPPPDRRKGEQRQQHVSVEDLRRELEKKQATIQRALVEQDRRRN